MKTCSRTDTSRTIKGSLSISDLSTLTLKACFYLLQKYLLYSKYMYTITNRENLIAAQKESLPFSSIWHKMPPSLFRNCCPFVSTIGVICRTHKFVSISNFFVCLGCKNRNRKIENKIIYFLRLWMIT